jgi:hypothetical protein
MVLFLMILPISHYTVEGGGRDLLDGDLSLGTIVGPYGANDFPSSSPTEEVLDLELFPVIGKPPRLGSD